MRLLLGRLGGGEPASVSVPEGATAAEALAAGGHVGAVLVHAGRILLQSEGLAAAGVEAGAQLTVVSLPPASLGLLEVTGINALEQQQVHEALAGAGHAPTEVAKVFDNIYCIYHSLADAEAARASAGLAAVLAAEEKWRSEREAEHPQSIYSSAGATVHSCIDPNCGIASYHLDGLRDATEEGALAVLRAAEEEELGIRAALQDLVASVEAGAGAEKDAGRRQVEQCQAAGLQLRILDTFLAARSTEAETALLHELQKQSESLRTLLDLIVRGRLLMHVDRFAETLAQLGYVTGLDAFQIETE